MNWDKFVFNFTAALGYAILIAWEYIKMEIVKKEDRRAITNAIKSGIEVEGAELVYNDSLILPKTPKEK